MKDMEENRWMKRAVILLYGICIVGFAVFLIYVRLNYHNDIFTGRQEVGCVVLDGIQVTKVEDEKAPVGIRLLYEIRIPDTVKEGSKLMFFTSHQGVTVKIADETVYSVKLSDGKRMGRTPGKFWNAIPIYCTDAKQTIVVTLTPVYQSGADADIEFYAGSKFEISLEVIRKEFALFFISFLSVVTGIVFMICTICFFRRRDMDKSLMMLGLFSLNIGLWKISDLKMTSLFLPYSLVRTYATYLFLMLVTVPYVMYLYHMMKTEKKRLWLFVCLAGIFVNIFALYMQLSGKKDMKELLWTTHAVMILVLITAVYLVVQEAREHGFRKRLWILAACLGATLSGMLADLLVYYFFKGSTALSMLGFLIYSTVLGILSMQDMRKLIAIGRKAKHFEEMAYHDQLTGLYNRAAYVDFTEDPQFRREDYMIVMCDLNNLKKCNDTRGHDKGDYYITKSANLIREIFHKNARWYRMGGDEFCILMKDVSLKECEKMAARLKTESEAYNNNHPGEFPMRIACGYAMYDAQNDYDFADTVRRADKMMYHEKFMMKQV